MNIPENWTKEILNEYYHHRRYMDGVRITIKLIPKNAYQRPSPRIAIYGDASNKFYIAPQGWSNLTIRSELLAGPFDSFEAAYTVYRINNYESLI